MTKIRTIILSCACLLGMAAMTSCTEGGDDQQPTLVGSSFFLPNSTEETVTVTMDFDGAWQISNNTSTWFSVSPLSGEAGSTDLTFTVFETNPDLSERVGGFVIEVDGVGTQYYVIQDVTPGFNAPAKTSVSGSAQEFVLNFYSNIEFEATTDADWLTIGDIAYEVSTLADGVTESKYRAYSINLSIAANDGEVRDGVITLTGNDDSTSATVTLSQMGELVADFSRTFYRRSLGMRFTATTCGWCPLMSEALHMAYEETEGRLVPFTIYGIMAGSDWMIYDHWLEWLNKFRIEGFPTGNVNGYAQVNNYDSSITSQIFTGLTEEAAAQLPANTVIGGSASYDGSNINVNLSVASKEAGSYILGIFLMESNIIGNQSGGGANYQHDFVVKDEFTDYMGDEISLSAESVKEFNYSIAVPSNIENIDNCYICVWTAEEGTYSGSVGYAIYADYGMLVDNVVTIPMNGFAIFDYED